MKSLNRWGDGEMIEETEQLIQHDLSSNIEEVEKEQIANNAGVKENLNPRNGTSLFFIQLLISSILIWSLLFIKDSYYGKQAINSLNQILSQEINVEPVEKVVNNLTLAVKQIL